MPPFPRVTRFVEIAWREPAALAAAWRGARHLAWLDSGGPVHGRSRYSFVCRDPFRIVTAQDSVVQVDGRAVAGDAFSVLQRELAALRAAPVQMPVPFAGGVVAALGYELGGVLERLPCRHGNDLSVPDMTALFYAAVVAFDRAERRAWVCATGAPAADCRAIETLLHRLDETAAPPPPLPQVAWQAELDRAAYTGAVQRVRDYIFAGDIFQANFTMRHLAARPPGLDPLAAFLALRDRTPAPFAAYMDCGPALALASVSPERFLRLDADGRIEARPIKGTLPRDADPARDAALAEALRASVKDRAENLMIVDLLRNDIGRVAQIGSIAVPELFCVESFPAVHHLVSAVTGRLAPGRDAVDLLRATFPGGSVTGAPKIRAMQIIDELEESRRGPYCGAIGWLGFDGAMDMNIVIRTVCITPKWLVAQAGGGIVADSDPEAEYEEMLVKVRPLLRALDRGA